MTEFDHDPLQDGRLPPDQAARRQFLKRLGLLGAAGAAGPVLSEPAWGGSTFMDALGSFFQDHYVACRMRRSQDALDRIERKRETQVRRGHRLQGCQAEPGVTYFGYALNLSKCQGYRDCVYACIQENNQGRDSQVQYIRVSNWTTAIATSSTPITTTTRTVPQDGKYYMPVQCMQCDNPPCVKACPVEATWKDEDGIVVIDYDWCIGCRYCMTACPYWARHFNWTEPRSRRKRSTRTPITSATGRGPRAWWRNATSAPSAPARGASRPARRPARPGRAFSAICSIRTARFATCWQHKTVFRLKEELGTEPKFWYFTD
jgi:Fe-S-cluster-containing dehydrogenase component